MKTVLFIPDSQVAPGVPIDHLEWIGKYIVDRWAGQKDFIIVHAGDFADMSSLSSYDKRGSRTMEGQRYAQDIAAANRAFDLLNAGMANYNTLQRTNKHVQWCPERHMLIGNHEDRITRAIEDDPRLEGVLSLDDLNYKAWGWQVHDYQTVLWIEGVAMSHFFYNPANGRPYSGMCETQLKSIGHSFVQGHRQGLMTAQRAVADTRHRGVIAGSCYLHNEDYRGPQATTEWRGVLVLHQVEAGNFDLMEVSLDYLCRRYTGQWLSKYTPRRFA